MARLSYSPNAALLGALAVLLVCTTSASANEPGEIAEQHRPTLRVYVGAGYAFGGSPVTGTVSPDGGDGMVFSAGVSVTPVWTGPVGLGVDAELGFKFDSGQTIAGSRALRRFPGIASLHGLLQIGTGLFAMVRGGLYAETGIKWFQDGTRGDGSEIDIPATVGPMAEGGVLYVIYPFGCHLTLRHTWLEYEVAGDETSANSLGFFFALHHVF